MDIRAFWSKNGSTILTIGSVLCGLAAPVLSAMETPKAIAAVEACKDENGVIDKKKAAIAAAKEYWPTVLVATAGIGCSIASKKVDASTISAMASLIKTTTENSRILEETVKNKVSAQKFDEIKCESDAKIAENKDIKQLAPTSTGYGEALFQAALGVDSGEVEFNNREDQSGCCRSYR